MYKHILNYSLLQRLCNETEINSIEVNKVQLVFGKGEKIFKENSTPQNFYRIVSGKVIITKQNAADFIINRFVGKDHIIGHHAILHGCNHLVTAEAIEITHIDIYPKDILLNIIDNNRNLYQEVMKTICDELSFDQERLVKMAYNPIKIRLADALLQLEQVYNAGNKTATNPINLSRDKIASYIGTVRESVARALSEFESLGYISANGRSIIIKNHDGLRKYSNIVYK